MIPPEPHDVAAQSIDARLQRLWAVGSERLDPTPPRGRARATFEPTDVIIAISCGLLALTATSDPMRLLAVGSLGLFLGVCVREALACRGNELLATQSFASREHRRLRRARWSFGVAFGALVIAVVALLSIPATAATVPWAVPLAALGTGILALRSALRVRESHGELAGQMRIFADDPGLFVEPEFRRSIAAQVVALSLTIVGSLAASAFAYVVESRGGVGASDMPNRVLVVGHAGRELEVWLGARGFEVEQTSLADAREAASLVDPADPSLIELADERGFGFLAFDLTLPEVALEIQVEPPIGSTFAVLPIGDLAVPGSEPTFGGPVKSVEHDLLVSREIGLLFALYEQPRLREARRDCVSDPVFGDMEGCRLAMAAIDEVELGQIRVRRQWLTAVERLALLSSRLAEGNEVVQAEPIAGGGALVEVRRTKFTSEDGGALGFEVDRASTFHLVRDLGKPLERTDCAARPGSSFLVDATGTWLAVRERGTVSVYAVRPEAAQEPCALAWTAELPSEAAIVIGPAGELAVAHGRIVFVQTSEGMRGRAIHTRGRVHMAFAGTALYVVDDESLHVVRADAEHEGTRLEGLLDGQLVELAASKPGRVFAFVGTLAPRGTKVLELRETGRGFEAVTRGHFAGAVGDVAISPNGQWAVASLTTDSGDALQRLWLDGGSEPLRLSHGGRHPTVPRTTLDGEHLLFDLPLAADGPPLRFTNLISLEGLEIEDHRVTPKASGRMDPGSASEPE